MSDLPKHGSEDYKKLRTKSKLLYDLGVVIIEQYGEKEAIKLLADYRKSKEEKDKK
jgi:hypothetical protein